jgi:ribosomal-protein-alanine N-acetyltransferase
MKIQSLTIDNAKELSGLNECNFNDGWTESMIISAFNGGRFFAFGAFIEDKLIASVTLSLGDEDADIEGIVVDKSQRGKGIASQLIDMAHDFIKENGKQKVLLEVRESNLPAISLYKKVGYKKISVRKRYYSDDENALVMLKEL